MKKFKVIMVYAVLVLLCTAALSGYLFSGNLKSIGVISGRKLTIEEKMKKAVAVPDPNPVVGIARGESQEEVTRKAVENAGGLKKVIRKGDTVLIKANLIGPAAVGEGIITDYRVIQAIADIARECGAERVIVADGSPHGNIFRYKPAKYHQITGVELIDFNECGKDDCYELKPEKSLTGHTFMIPKVYMDADVVISAALLKTHFEAVVTLSLKNSFGVPPLSFYSSMGEGKIKLHEMGMSKSIVDLNKIRKPDFVVVDGIVGGEGNGPLRPIPVNSNIVLAGSDPVAVDTVALNFMGFTIDDVWHVKLAGREGLGISDIGKIKINGADLEAIKMKFKRPSSY